MTHRLFLRRTTVVLAATVLSLSILSGCGIFKKRQANAKIEEVQASLDAVRARGADRYLPNLYNQASSMLNNARGGVDGGTYDDAIANAENAAGVVSQIESQVDMKRQEVEAKKAQLIDLQGKINQTVESVQTIGPERTDVTQGAEELNNFIQQVQTAQAQVSEGESGYDNALMKANAFLSTATQALAELEVSKSKQLLQDIQDAWGRAQSVEVLDYVDAAKDVPQEIETIQSLIAQGKGREVLQQYSGLPDTIAQYEDRAREDRANAQIDRAQRLIEIAEKEPDASLDGIESAKSALEEAREALQEGNYANAFNAAGRSLETARAEVQFLESDLQDQIDQLAARLEESLKWETPKLAGETYEEALTSLDKARDNMKEILFTEAQSSIDQGSLKAEEAIAAARQIGLNQRIETESENLKQTQEIGAFTYLRDEYQAIQDLIAEAKTQVSRTSYDEAELTLDEVNNRILGLETKLQELAQSKLADAEAAYQEAVDAESAKYAEDLLSKTSTVMDDARSAAAQANWKDAIQAANEALESASSASSQSYRLRTDELQPEAEEELAMSQEAGAAGYAADIYNQALAAKEHSGVAYSNDNFKTALQELTQARDLGVKARNHMIESAQKAVDSAIDAQGNDYEQQLLGEALASLADAREKMKSSNYTDSLSAARVAKEKAETAETRTWEARAKTSIADLNKKRADAETGRGPTYAEEEFGKMARTLKEAEADFAAGNFKEAYQASDRGHQEADQVFARLKDEARLVRGDYDRQVALLKTFVEEDTGRAFLEQATLRLGRIDDAILNEDLGRAFALYEEGDREVTSQIQAIKVININNKISNLKARVQEDQANGLFQFVDTTADEYMAQLNGVEYDPELDRLKPNQDLYTEAIRELARYESELDRMKDRAISNVETRIQRVRTDIDNAREIGARDLVKAVFDSAVDSYEKTRDLLYVIRNNLESETPANFVTLGNQLGQAESQAAQLNQTVIGQRNSVDYLRDLILWTYDMTRYLDQWYPIEELGYQMIMIAEPTSAVDSYSEMQTGISAADLLTEAERLYDRISPITPPPDQAQLHALALASFKKFLESADGFYRYGQYSRYPKSQREGFLYQAFTHLEELHLMNERLMVAILRQVRDYDLVDFERELADEFKAFKTYLRRDKTAK
ncbi:MAG: DUF4398 domain-containing protein [Candidatus Omnitrophica bacterium]|nr:DUF4398 domain-containing protein [Candidatus Omnitrophota bacterium]